MARFHFCGILHSCGALAGVSCSAHAASAWLCVVSHSFSENILRDYRENDLPAPDMVFGWEVPREKRKPQPDALYEIMSHFDLKPEELLVLDDLKPGYDMAKAGGVRFAAAGWANDIPEIERFMRKNCDLYFKTVAEFRAHLFEEEKPGCCLPGSAEPSGEPPAV